MARGCILVIRQSDDFSFHLSNAGFEVLNLPLIHTRPVEDLDQIRQTFENIDKYDGIFFTSPVSVQVFLDQMNGEAERFRGAVYVLGARAKAVVERSPLRMVYVENANTAEDLLSSLGTAEFTGKKLLFIRGDKSVRTIPEQLSHSASVEELVVYNTVSITPDPATLADIRNRLLAGNIVEICFFSPSGVDSFAALFDRSTYAGVGVACIGPTTARAAEAAGFRVEFTAPRANGAEFAAALAEHINDIE